ncbi:PREDICTED: alkylated DNA repair protein alkB homolog 8-like, partial [Galeopterus variegatus]|uniref:Alkylated DNA repair protein alkB homolog 8-like n=1 Tax=Galeopterus variegatus TaxID=482537 RepID=A0ABM0SJ52_GALVR
MLENATPGGRMPVLHSTSSVHWVMLDSKGRLSGTAFHRYFQGVFYALPSTLPPEASSIDRPDPNSRKSDSRVFFHKGFKIVMDFKHPDGVTVPVMLPRRSLLVMTGEPRYLWTMGQADIVQADHFNSVENKFYALERRVAALQELVRLLRPGGKGKALIYVWAMEQEHTKQKSKYHRGNRISQGKKEEIISDTSMQGLLVEHMPGNQDSASSVPSIIDFQETGCNSRKAANSQLPIHINRTSFHSQDVLVPWHLKGNPCKDKPVEPFGPAGCHDSSPVFHHFYHVFCEGELEAACQAL